MVTTVYLIRHGRTGLNAAGLLRGRVNVPLDPVGRMEADRLGAFFSGVQFARIVSSPLDRSLDTARALAAPHGLGVTVDEAFADRNYGPWAGRSQRKVEARYGSVDDAPADEIEPRGAFAQRVVAALERVVGEATGEIVAVVAHDAVNRALIEALGHPQGGSADLPQPTGCWNRIVFSDGAARCEIVGALPGDGTEP